MQHQSMVVTIRGLSRLSSEAGEGLRRRKHCQSQFLSFRLCLKGGSESHDNTIRSIRELANAFSSYKVEVLLKHSELLHYSQDAISVLKLNPYLERLEIEASTLWQHLDQAVALYSTSNGNDEIISDATALEKTEAVENVLANVQLCFSLESLMLRKKLVDNGGSVETLSENFNKLKILAQSMAKSRSSAEKRISDQRHHIEEALKFREAKTDEIKNRETKILMEISRLEKLREKFEAQLGQVKENLKDSFVRLKKTKEEKGQFEESSNQIVLLLKAKEVELSRSVASCKAEADAVRALIKFLEKTLVIQSNLTAEKEKQIDDELEKFGNFFMMLIRHHLLSFKRELGSSINHAKTILDNFKIVNNKNNRSEIKELVDCEMEKSLEEAYLKAERKVLAAFNQVDRVRDFFYIERDNTRREETLEMKHMFDAIETMKQEFVSLGIPLLEMEMNCARHGTSVVDSQSHEKKNSLEVEMPIQSLDEETLQAESSGTTS